MNTRPVVPEPRQASTIVAALDALAQAAGMPTRREAHQKGLCVIGGHPVTWEQYQSWGDADRSEYRISGCCPACFDKLFGHPTPLDPETHGFITVYQPICGWKTVMYLPDPEMDGELAPYQTGLCAYGTEAEAIAAAKAWAQDEGKIFKYKAETIYPS